jgi:hypothetical protein
MAQKIWSFPLPRFASAIKPKTFVRVAIDFHDIKHLQALHAWEVAQATYTKGKST